MLLIWCFPSWSKRLLNQPLGIGSLTRRPDGLLVTVKHKQRHLICISRKLVLFTYSHHRFVKSWTRQDILPASVQETPKSDSKEITKKKNAWLPQIHETNSILRAWANFDNSFSYCLKVFAGQDQKRRKFFFAGWIEFCTTENTISCWT